jgi:hypothetical protein
MWAVHQGVFRGNESRIYDHVSDQAYKVIGPYALQPFVIDGDLQVDLRSQSILIDIQLETTPSDVQVKVIH